MVFVNFDKPDWVALSPSLAMLLSLCDGQRTMEELAGMFQVDGAAISLDLLGKLINNFRDRGMLTGPDASADDDPGSLTTLALYVTGGCNLRCRYCFISASTPLPGELSTAEITGLMEQFKAQGGRLLLFMGGEPLLRPDIIELGRHAKSLGLTSNLISNGTLLEPGLARQVAQTFDSVQVSLDGLEAYNDHFRGRGSYKAAVAGLRNLLELGVEPTVSTVVSNSNIDELDSFMAELVRLGAQRVHFVNLQSCGRGRTAGCTSLSNLDFTRRLLTLWQRWGHRLEFPKDMLLSLPRGQRKLNCGPAEGIMEIDARGLAFPCYYFMEKGQAGGDLRRQSLVDIYRDSPRLNNLRRVSVDNHPRCAACRYRYFCGGGCMGADMPGDRFCQDMIEVIDWVLLEGRELGLHEPNPIDDSRLAESQGHATPRPI